MENNTMDDQISPRALQSSKKTQNHTTGYVDEHPIKQLLAAELKADNTSNNRSQQSKSISAKLLEEMIVDGSSETTIQQQVATSLSNIVSSHQGVECNRQLFLCSPDFLELKYVINPWMNLSTPFSLEKAKSQWEDLVSVYKKIVPEAVVTVTPREKLTELCFFGDSVFAYNGRAVFGRFATDERFPETAYVMEYLRSIGIDGERVDEQLHFEGSGETMMWNGNILVGYGRRSTSGIADYLQKTFPENPVLGFELIDPEFYHLDTAMFPISNDLIAVYEAAFSEQAKAKIKSLGCEIMYLTYKDAKEFALNSIALGKHLIVHYEAEDFIRNLQERGYTVHSVDVSEFIKFGGGLKCLTFQHYLKQ